MSREKFLIINADDFGMCRAHNIATAELLKIGSITSATVMAPCKYAHDAVKFSIENPNFAIGIHLTTTSEWRNYRWKPLSENVPSLKDPNGFFYHTSDEFAKSAKKSEVETELKAQIEYLIKLGLNPSHIDNHMGSLYGITNGDFSLLKLTLELAAKYGLPFRFPSKISDDTFKNGTLNIKTKAETVISEFDRFVDFVRRSGVLTPDYLIPGDWNGEQDKSYESYREYMYALLSGVDNGVSETYIHPAVECEEIKAITPCWHRRVWEHRLFSDPETVKFIKSNGITVISYRDLKKIKG